MAASRRAVAVIDQPASPARTGRTKGLLPGNKNLPKDRGPPLQTRVAIAAGAVLGESMGELVRNVLEGVKRKTISASMGKMLIERLVPPARPIRLDIPRIRSAEDLERAQSLIVDALNDGRIVPAEASALQAVVGEAWRCCLEAHEHPNLGDKDQIDPAAYRERICKAAESFGMSWPADQDIATSPRKSSPR